MKITSNLTTQHTRIWIKRDWWSKLFQNSTIQWSWEL